MNARRNAVAALGLFALVVFASPIAWAQFTSAIEGTVTDPSGAVVPNATVTVKNVDTAVTRTVQTTDAGNYRVPSLPAGKYDITVTAVGFKTSTESGVTLEGTQTKAVNFTLQLGATTSEVTVTGAAPAVETSEARVSAQINETRVKNLPLVGRNFYTLVVLTPGVTGLPSGGGQAYAQANADIFNAEYGVNLNANGQRAESNSFLVDSGSSNGSPRGGVTNLTPNADSVQELRVSVNNFSAEYGRNSSALVNVVTKSGTNDFHGTASWFHTNNHLAAANVFQNGCIRRLDGSCNRLPVFRRNEGAWSFGGPIRKDKTFFFASMDFLRSGVGTTFRSSVVSPQFISYMEQAYPSNISTYVMKSFLPKAILQENQITAGSQLGTDCSTLSGGPGSAISTPIGSLPCNMPLTVGATFSDTIPRNGLQWNVRIDHTWHDSKDRIYGNWYKTSRQTVTFASPSIYPAFTGNEPEYTMYFNFNYTHIFTPTLLLESAVTFTRARGDVQVANGQIPNINVPGIAAYGMNFSGPTFIQNNGEWRNVLTWNRGRHAFKFGGNYARDDAWGSGAQFGPNFTRYYYSFNNLYDFALDHPFSESNYGFNPRTGSAFGPSFLPIFPRFGMFANDDWKVKPNLTVSLGLRWEVFQIPREQHNPPEITNMYFPSGSTFQERIANGIMQVRPFWDKTDYRNFAPRLGIAWDPTGKGKMSIRAGVGIFYDRPAGQLIHDCCTTLPLFANISVSQQTAVKPVYGLGTLKAPPWGFPQLVGLTTGLNAQGGLIDAAGNPVPSDIDSIQQPALTTQRSGNWFFGIQYALSNNWTVEANYVGSVGRHLYQNYDVNRVDGDLIQNNGSLKRLNHSFGQLLYAQSNGSSVYNGVNFGVKKRFSRGLDFQAGYTYGKAIDQASSFGRNLAMVDIYHLNLNRGLSDFDIRQKVGASLVYDLPSPKERGTLKSILRGWQVGTVIILQSGSPYSVFCGTPFIPVRANPNDPTSAIVGNAGCDFNADGFNYDFPNSTIGNFKSGSKQDFLRGVVKASDFTIPAVGQDGTLGRNTFIGPGYANTDFNAVKNTKIPWFWGNEGANVQFRAEFFNLFNRVNLQNPNGGLPSPVPDPSNPGHYVFPNGTSFGQSGSSYPARDIQFGIKLSF
jgi:hypothetical protein